MRYSAALLAFAASAVVAQPHRHSRRGVCKHPQKIIGGVESSPFGDHYEDPLHEMKEYDDQDDDGQVDNSPVETQAGGEHSQPEKEHKEEPHAPTKDVKSGHHSGPFANQGEMTFFKTGLGACGEVCDGNAMGESADDAMIMAVSYDTYFKGLGNPNHNPLCGKLVRLRANGVERIAKICDACHGCKMSGDADVSQPAFNQFYPTSTGRAPCEWELMDD